MMNSSPTSITELSGQGKALPLQGVSGPEDSRFIYFASLFAVAAWILSRLSGCLNRVVFFDGAVADGPFQLFNYLRRLSAGQVAGRDFPIFHGLGLPWLHYPLFRLFGEGLYGSEMSRQLTSTVLCTAGMVVMLRSISDTWRRTVLLIALVLILLQAPAQIFGTFSDPGVSMTDLRAMAPLTGAVLYATVRAKWLRVTLLALCLGAALLLGVDQAPPFFLAVSAVAVALLIRHFRNNALDSLGVLSELMIAFACGLVLALGLMLLVSGGAGTMAALKFNFVEAAGDQFWFFGIPSNSYVPTDVEYFKSAADLFTHIYSIPLLVWLVAAGSALVWLVRRPDLPVRGVGCAILLCYGFLSAVPSLGYLGNTYLKDGTSAMLLALLLSQGDAVSAFLRRVRRLLGAGLLAFALFQSALAARKLEELVHAPDLHSVHFSERWQEILRTGENLIQRYRSRGDRALWATYSGEPGSRTGEFLPAEDYIIHALGPERRAHYLDAFRATKPAVAMTAAFGSEQWLQNETWGLYEELLTHYTLASRAGGRTNGAVYWVRNEPDAGSISRTPGKARLVDGTHFVIESPGAGKSRLGTVSIRYEIRYSSGFSRFLSKMARYLIAGNSPARPVPVSLPPYAREWTFPVVTTNVPVSFAVATSGILANGQVSITEVSVEWWPETAPVSLFDAVSLSQPESSLP